MSTATYLLAHADTVGHFYMIEALMGIAIGMYFAVPITPWKLIQARIVPTTMLSRRITAPRIARIFPHLRIPAPGALAVALAVIVSPSSSGPEAASVPPVTLYDAPSALAPAPTARRPLRLRRLPA